MVSALVASHLQPDYALFRAAADNPSVFQPNKNSDINPEHLSFFRFVGRFVGKAIYDGQNLDAYFTRSFYKHLLGIKPSFQDIESFDPAMFKSLKWIRDSPVDESLGVVFSTEVDEFGVSKTIELRPKGLDIAVTDQNKMEYLQLITEYVTSLSIQRQIDAFLSGFRELIPAHMISMFNEQEMELLISGLPEVDLNDLKANTEYRGWDSSNTKAAEMHPTIQWFWQVVTDFDQEERALLLLFVTGTSKVPIDGFKALQGMDGPTRFTIQKGAGKDRLPAAHTCFNQLDLPEYSSLDVLREKLLIALHEGSQGYSFR